MIAFDRALAEERLGALGALRAPCVACGSVEWRVDGRLRVVWEYEELPDVVEVSADGVGSRVAAAVCAHCGNVRFHDWGLLTAATASDAL